MNKQEAWQHLSELDQVAQFIGKRLLKARIPVSDFKEKWGTVRVYCTFGWYSLHDIVYPGFHFNHFPLWLQNLDYYVISHVVQRLSNLAFPLQVRWYRQTYKKALEKWPHLRYPILECADYPEYLEGL